MNEEVIKLIEEPIEKLYNSIMEKPLQVLNIFNDFFGEERVEALMKKEDGNEVVFERGFLSVSDGYDGFSFRIKSDKFDLIGRNGKLISSIVEERIDGFDKETIKTPFSPLTFWYDSVYSALESGVWPREKYMATLKGLELINQTEKFLV